MYPIGTHEIEPRRPLVTIYLPDDPDDDGTHYHLYHHLLNRTVTVSEVGEHYGILANVLEDVFDPPTDAVIALDEIAAVLKVGTETLDAHDLLSRVTKIANIIKATGRL